MMKARILPPALPVVVLLTVVFTVPAFGQATPPFDRTIIVGGGGTDLANGTALLTAVNDALTSPFPPTAGNPWLIKVEPGIFDLANQTLQLQSWIDIEGSGRNATFIRSAGSPFTPRPSTVNVGSSINSELRNLTVQYLSTSNSGGAGLTNASSELKLTQVNIEVEGPKDVFGIVSTSGSPRISAVFSRVASINGGNAIGMLVQRGGPVVLEMFVFIKNEADERNVGIQVETGASLVLDKTSGVVFGGKSNIGLRSVGGSADVTNNRWSVSTGTLAIGVQILDSSDVASRFPFEIKESTFEALSASTKVGLSNESKGGAVTVKDTILFTPVDPASFPGSIGAQNTVEGAATDIHQSIVSGNLSLWNQVPTTVFRVGATQLAGARSIALGSTAVCAASYDGAYATLPPGC
ncbi:MAG: hypothetical protein AAGC60_29195 [Acidobacteriota bacterium]